jgi:type II secretory ATPase GspE/PulE/Tfp pilus assembly ATPase PilB-like protein
MIAGGAVIEQLRAHLNNARFKTLYDDAEEKISGGLTTEAEIRRELGVRL